MYLFRALGTVTLEGQGGRRVSGRATQARQLALLAILAVRPGDGWSRDQLVALLWPDHDQERARHNLADALYVLRRQLGDDTLHSEGDRVRLDPERVRTDVGLFETHVEAGALDEAVKSYGGPFLDGFHLQGSPDTFEEWVDTERRRLADRHRTALETLAERADQGDDFQNAVARWKSLRALDPYSTRYAIGLMGALSRMGDPAAALRQARLHEELLGEELGLRPPPELSEAVAEIRTVPATPRTVPSRPGPVAPASYAPSGPDVSWESWVRPTVAAVLLIAAVSIVWALAADRIASREGGTTDRRGLTPAAVPSLRAPSVAVLPFDNLSAEPENRYVADGVAEDLTIALGLAGGIQVTSRTSVMKYRDHPADAQDIGRELGVSHLVEGSLRQSGDRVVVSAHLIDAGTGRQVWARSYDRAAAELLAVQREIAGAVARELLGRLSPEAAQRVATPPTTDPAAYDFFRRGRDYQTRSPTQDGENHRSALRMYEAAVARDSGFAEAWARAAYSHVSARSIGRENADVEWIGTPSDRLALARAAAARALASDPDGPWGHWALADLHNRATGDLDSAEAHLRRAEAAGLVTSELLWKRAEIVRRRAGPGWHDRELLEESTALFERARALDPLNEGIIFQSWFNYLWLRRYDDAEEALERVIELSPDHEGARRYLSRLPLLREGDAEAVGPPASGEWETLWRLGDLEAALAAAGDESPTGQGRTQARRGLVLAAMGDSIAAAEAFDSALVLLEPEVRQDSLAASLRWLGIALAARGQEREARHVAESAALHGELRFWVALMQIQLGDDGAAITTLDEYLANPGPRSFRNVLTHPLVAPLRDHPRFRALEHRYGRE